MHNVIGEHMDYPLHHKLCACITSHYIISSIHSNHLITTFFVTVFSLFCHHYKQLCDELTHYGYHMIKKVPTPSGNMSTTLFDQGIPLITSSCSECELPREVAELLRTPTMPDSWNILYLHQNGSGDVTQWNERIKVVHIDFNNGSVVEVLNWLSAKLPRRSSTSVGWRTTRFVKQNRKS